MASCVGGFSAALGDVHHYAAMVWTRPKAVDADQELSVLFSCAEIIATEN